MAASDALAAHRAPVALQLARALGAQPVPALEHRKCVEVGRFLQP
jgi:hypothetical protein